MAGWLAEETLSDGLRQHARTVAECVYILYGQPNLSLSGCEPAADRRRHRRRLLPPTSSSPTQLRGAFQVVTQSPETGEKKIS